MKNISKIISIVFLSLSTLLFFYIFYRSELYHLGEKHDFYLKYYIISFSFICLSLFSFFISKKIKIIIAFTNFLFIIGLYLLEIYIASTVNPYHLYNKLKKVDQDIVVLIARVDFLNEINKKTIPLAGISNKKTIQCKENVYFSIYNSDRYGFDNPNNEWDKKQVEFLIVGDSFAQGGCVNERDTISGNLRKKVETGSVLNLGYGGNGPLREYATLREYLPLIKTKRVLWIYQENSDLLDLEAEINHPILAKYLNNKEFSQNLYLKQINIDKELNNILLERKKNNKKEYFIKFVKLYHLRTLFFPPKTINFPLINVLPEFERVLKESKEFVENSGAKLYFIYLPGFYRFSNKNVYYKYDYDKLYFYKKILQTLKSLNIPIIDIKKDLFEKHEDPLSLFPFRSLGHYNEQGFKLVAETIFNQIQKYENGD